MTQTFWERINTNVYVTEDNWSIIRRFGYFVKLRPEEINLDAGRFVNFSPIPIDGYKVTVRRLHDRGFEQIEEWVEHICEAGGNWWATSCSRGGQTGDYLTFVFQDEVTAVYFKLRFG